MEITSPNTIQPGEHSRGGGRDDILRILGNSDGNLNVPYLNWNGDRWILNFNRLDNDWNGHSRLARRQFLYSPVLGAGVSFLSDPAQPPIILPMATKETDNIEYFLVSTAFISQSTFRKNLSASNLVLNFCTTACFSLRAAYPASSDNSRQSVKRLSIFIPRV